jgi:hypothetical protein
MGSLIEINDTLKLPQGAITEPFKEGVEYTFKRQDRRLYHLHPIRVFLVIERNKKWDYIGHALILSQTINALENTTEGIFIIDKLYTDAHRENMKRYETPT